METLGALTTVVAFGKEEYFCNKFETILKQIDRYRQVPALLDLDTE